MINRKDLQNIESLFMLSPLGECRSKRKAAEAIGASVDTLNKYIGNLEAEFGLQLVISSEHGCTLTPKGVKFTENASRMEELLQQMYAENGRNTQNFFPVKVGMDVGISSNLMFYDIDAFFSRFPDIQIQSIIFQDSLQLQYNNLDIGISYCEPKEKDVTVLAVKNIECKLFASPAYLKKYGYPQNIKDIVKNHRIVCKSDPVYYDKQYREILKNSENVRYISNSSGSVIDAVRNNAGICVMPLRFAEEGLICLDNFDWNSHISIYLFSRKRVKDLPRVRAVINYFKEILQRM